MVGFNQLSYVVSFNQLSYVVSFSQLSYVVSFNQLSYVVSFSQLCSDMKCNSLQHKGQKLFPRLYLSFKGGCGHVRRKDWG